MISGLMSRSVGWRWCQSGVAPFQASEVRKKGLGFVEA